MTSASKNSTTDKVATKLVQVCQGKTCQKQGSAKVLKAFQTQTSAEISVNGCSCLGQCGNGPMVVILPNQTWYSSVNTQEVPLVVKQDLQQGKPVTAMLYAKFHPPQQKNKTKLSWLFIVLTISSFLISVLLYSLLIISSLS